MRYLVKLSYVSLCRTTWGFLILVQFIPLSSPGDGLGPCSNKGEPRRQVWDQVLMLATAESTPQWSPDGRHIALSLGRGSTYLVRSDGSQVKRVSQGKEEYEVDFSPDLSPDGTRIVYATSRHVFVSTKTFQEGGTYDQVVRTFEIETSDLDGSDHQRLTENRDIDLSPVWSPDGTRIAFVKVDWHGDGSNDAGLYTMAWDGSNQRRLMRFFPSGLGRRGDTELSHQGFGPAWSPDGTELAIVLKEIVQESANGTQAVPNTSRSVLYIVRADGSGHRQLFATPRSMTDEIIGTPDWSPTGHQVAFLSFGYPENAGQSSSRVILYTINRHGSDLNLVTEVRGAGDYRGLTGLDWSPVRDQILFFLPTISVTPEGTIYTVDTDGHQMRVIGKGFRASWSPDGRRIAFVNSGAATMAPDGTDVRPILTIDDQGKMKPATLVEAECIWVFCR